MKNLIAATLMLAGLSGGATAATYTLTFDNQTGTCESASCSGSSAINQGYGDIDGIVNVSYFDTNKPGGGKLYWWDRDYNDLKGVVWSGSSHGRIEISPVAGRVTLDSFDMGAWINASRATHVRITDIGATTTLFAYDGKVGNLSSHTSFSPAVSSSRGLWIDWYEDAYSVGIDNVKFTISAVPEPDTYALLIAGMGIIGVIARRKRLSHC